LHPHRGTRCRSPLLAAASGRGSPFHSLGRTKGRTWKCRPCSFAALPLDRAARLRGRRTAAVIVAVRRQLSRGLSVLRRPASRRFGFEDAALVRAASLAHLSCALRPSNHIQMQGSLFQRSLPSSALRSTAAPGRWFGAGTGFARAAGVGALGHENNTVRLVSRAGLCSFAGVGALGNRQSATLVVGHTSSRSAVRPNPSIEGTHSGLRPPCAPHVKR